MKKILLVDNVAETATANTIVIDAKEMLRFSRDVDFTRNAVVEFMNKLPSSTVNGISIKEWFRFRDHSLWWFAHSHLRSKIDTYLRFIIIFENMLDAIQPDVVEIRGFYDKTDLIKQICEKKKVRLSIGISSRFKISLLSFKQRIRNRLFLKGTDIITKRKEAKRRALAREAGRTQTQNIRKGCIIYVSFPLYRRLIYDLQERKIYEGEYVSQRILRRIKEKGIDLLCIEVDPRVKGNFKPLRQRLNDKDQYWIPIETLIAAKPITEELQRSIKETTRMLTRLFKEPDFRRIFNYDGINLWNMISFQMDLLMADRSLPKSMRDIQGIKSTLADLEPRSIFLIYERSPTAMTFIIAANELGMKTVGMQHGIIHKAHLDYSVNEIRTSNCIFGCPVPTITLVFGEFYKKLLTEKFAYQPEMVAVVGNPVYEGTDKYQKRLDRKAILAKLGLDPMKKTILVATSMKQRKYGSEEYDIITVETLARSFANLDNMQVVVKLHPGEDGAVYRKIIAKNGAANFVILDHHPIIELLLICDVFVVVSSTTMIEAVVLGRPIIVIQVSEKANGDLFSLVESKAAIGSNVADLTGKVLDVLNNEARAAELLSGGSEFAKQHFNLPNNEINSRITDILIDPGKVLGKDSQGQS